MSKSLRKRNIEKQLNNRKEYYDREEKEKKTVQINTRCTAHTKKILDEKVKESGLTVSEYITRLIEEGQVNVYPDSRKLAEQLAEIKYKLSWIKGTNDDWLQQFYQDTIRFLEQQESDIAKFLMNKSEEE